MTTSDEVLARWRAEARAVLPAASPELLEEVAGHLADRWTAVRIETGSDAAADRAARADLDGWRGRTAPDTLEPTAARRARIGAGLTLDVAAAWRRLTVRPLAAAGAVVLTAVGVSAALAVFALAYGVLWRPLPYPEPSRLVTVWQSVKDDLTQISYPDYENLRGTGAFESSAALSAGTGTLATGAPGEADRVQAVEAEPALLTMLGAQPVLGRLLTADDGGKPLAMISHRLWQSRFNGDLAIVGRAFTLSGASYTVIGVLPATFDLELPVFPNFLLQHADIWTSFDRSSPFASRRDVSAYEVVARLAPGVAIDNAQQRAEATASTLAAQLPSTNRDRTFRLIPLRNLLVERAARPLKLACAGAAMVLLIALSNLTTLALGRLRVRQSELAVRQSLGATRWRIARQVLVDDLPVALIGGLIGVGAGATLARAIAASSAARLPRPDAVRLDGPVVAATLAVVAVMWIVPALIGLRLLGRRSTALHADERVVGRTARRARRLLVAAEFALALVLATSAALLSLALLRLGAIDPGFARRGTLTMRVSAYAKAYPTKDAVTDFFRTIASGIERLPGVELAAAGSSLPLSGQATGTSVMWSDRPLPPSARLTAGWQFVTPGYFRAAGVPIVRGRDFTDDDRSRSTHVTILDLAAARALFGDADPIGRRVAIGGDDANGDWHEVIGVVGDVRHVALTEAPSPRVYDLLGQHWGRTMYIVVRAKPGVDAASLTASVRKTISSVNPDAPIFEVATTDALIGRAAAPWRVAATLGAGLALVSLVLALLGMFAVVACSVTERLRELGVRIALGATTTQIFALILRDALATSAIGCAAGVLGSVALVPTLAGQLFGVHAADAEVLVPLMAIALTAASMLAAWWPARRATVVDPLEALRAVE